MAIIGLQKRTGKRLIFREKSGNFEMDIQASHKLWKSWKTRKITKSFMHGIIMEFEKNN